jgi:hypothetical protein
MRRVAWRVAPILLAACGTWACQSPTAASTPDFIVVTTSPDPAQAAGPGTGKFYKIVGDATHADQILEYEWLTQFNMNITLNQNATTSNVGVKFPVDLTSLTVKVQQASGGIVTPPTGGDVEHYEFLTAANSNHFPDVNSSINIGFSVWYHLPSLRKESLITVSMSFKDTNGATFSKSVDVKVAP